MTLTGTYSHASQAPVSGPGLNGHPMTSPFLGGTPRWDGREFLDRLNMAPQEGFMPFRLGIRPNERSRDYDFAWSAKSCPATQGGGSSLALRLPYGRSPKPVRAEARPRAVGAYAPPPRERLAQAKLRERHNVITRLDWVTQ